MQKHRYFQRKRHKNVTIKVNNLKKKRFARDVFGQVHSSFYYIVLNEII